MHPAFSLIFFTTLSGAGFGAMAGASMLPVVLGEPGFRIAMILGFIAAGLGLCGSVLHLKSPTRARFALSQFRTSWLSREGVLALLTMSAAAVVLILELTGNLATPDLAVDIATPWVLALICGATVWCTGMIYQSIGAVPAWSKQPTSLLFLLFAATAGGLVVLAAAGAASNMGYGLGLFFLFTVWYFKITIWGRMDRQDPTATVESATGLKGDVRLFERPHVTENWLTREMGFRVARRHSMKFRMMAVILGGLIPAAIIALPLAGLAAHWVCWFAVIAHLGGAMVERWLFFAEARHVQSLYYGETAV